MAAMSAGLDQRPTNTSMTQALRSDSSFALDGFARQRGTGRSWFFVVAIRRPEPNSQGRGNGNDDG